VSEDQVENSSVLTFEGAEIRVSGLHNEVDLDAQKARLEKLISEKEKQVNGFRTRLSNKGYLENAKPEIIEETRNMLASAEADLEAAQRSLSNLD
jgi:valyl-tRNA synthetase